MNGAFTSFLPDPSDIPWVLLYSAVVALLMLVWAYVPA